MHCLFNPNSFIFKLISCPEFRERHKSNPRHFTRKSPLSFAKITKLILKGINKSLQIEANQMADILECEPVTKQALSAARYRVKASAFQEIHEKCLENYYKDNNKNLWKGYRVFAGDGTTLQLPKRGDIGEVYGNHFKRTVLARVNQYVDIGNDLVVSALIEPYEKSEVGMTFEMLPVLVQKFKQLNQLKQIYIYDRGFPSHRLAQKHLDLGVDYLFRVQKNYTNEIKEMVENGFEGDFTFTEKRKEIDYKARVIIRYLQSGQPLVLVTSLLSDCEFLSSDLVDLYQMRWRCEESYKFQKILLEMDCMYCRTAQGVEQDFYATVALALIMGICFEQHEDRCLEGNLNMKSKVNRSVVFGSLKGLHLQALFGKCPLEEYENKFERYCQKYRCKIRPGRSYPRLSVDTRKTRHCHRRH